MCGASDEQKALEVQQQSFSSLLQANYSQRFNAQSNAFQALNNQFTPIAEAGPDQQGFGGNQLAALNTEAGEGVGQNYANASRALNTQLSAQGGGNEALPTGAAAALKGNLASAAANQQSSEQMAITNANYGQGRQNWQEATAGLNALGQEYNPNALAGETTSTASAAYGEAQQDAMQGYQQFDDIASGIGDVLKGGGALASGVAALSNASTSAFSAGAPG